MEFKYKNRTYWYNHNMMWVHESRRHNIGKSFSTKRNRIVASIGCADNGGFYFEFKDEPGKEYQCRNTWAFIERTPVNRILFPVYLALTGVIKWLQRKASKLILHLDTLS